MTSPMPPVTVTIFGEDYTLSGVDDPRYIAEVAAHLDARMRDIAGTGKVLPAARVCILAALNITDELLRLRDESRRREETLNETLDDLIRILDGVLAPTPARPASGK